MIFICTIILVRNLVLFTFKKQLVGTGINIANQTRSTLELSTKIGTVRTLNVLDSL